MPRHLEFTDVRLQHLFRWEQDGVVSRGQLLELGATDEDIARMVRRRELSIAHAGVYLNHSGTPNRQQREWIAVLTCAPAALSHESAMPGDNPQIVHLCIATGRTLQRLRGVVIHRSAHLDSRVDWNRRPPRMLPAHATIDVLEQRIQRDDIAGAYAALTRACFTREVWPSQLRAALSERQRVTARSLISNMFDDVEDGACSVLERGYLYRVERAHGLPQGTRQQRSHATGSRTYQDVHYERYGVAVELDGRAFHDSPEARDRDALRDLASSAVAGVHTVRLTYGLVFNDSCRTAQWMAAVLRRRGWAGELAPCPRCL